MNNYLARLPQAARRTGSVANNEIELVTDPSDIETIRAARRQRVQRGDLPSTSDDLGIVFEDDYFVIVRDPVRFPSGELSTYVRIFEKSALDGPSGAILVAVRRRRVLLRRMFRHATRAWELECPRGFRERDQTIEQTVAIETRQELGLSIERIEPLGTVSPNTGLFAGFASAFFIEVGDEDPRPRPEPHEAMGAIEELPTSAVFERIANGEIRDGLTLASLMLAHTRGLLP